MFVIFRVTQTDRKRESESGRFIGLFVLKYQGHTERWFITGSSAPALRTDDTKKKLLGNKFRLAFKHTMRFISAQFFFIINIYKTATTTTR